ncbi:MAG: hypothetical protein BHW58_04950 [Azospirillum sp. 51_20]|jgi:methyl-accepting chemotaxis protein|nr:MAG: hypothetical protein BHW58_04950 [Azospirillum sp. 51_20]
METEISRFKETAEALNEIDAALNELQRAFENKRENVSRLKETAARSVARIDELINKLNTAREQNGTSNGND